MRSDITLCLAVAAVILAAAAYGGAAMLGEKSPDVVETATPTEVQSTLDLDGVIVRNEALVLCDFSEYDFVPDEGEFVSGGDILCIPKSSAGAYYTCCDMGDDYGGKAVKAPTSGYFCTDLDGLESASVDDCLELSPHTAENAVCRIVYGASWYFVAPAPDGSFAEGDEVTLTILDTYPATVQSAHDGIVVLRVREGLYSVLSLRHTTATVMW